jgi:hypothetical protein
VLIDLELPFADVRAADLVLSIDSPAQRALSTLRCQVAGFDLELRLLGCSHQALVRAEHFELSELVACLPGTDGTLPRSAREERSGGRYEFRARVEEFGGGEYAEAARRLTDELGGAADALVGRFPGPGDAFTTLCFSGLPAAAGIRWETWHGYPQTHEIVHTSSEVRR